MEVTPGKLSIIELPGDFNSLGIHAHLDALQARLEGYRIDRKVAPRIVMFRNSGLTQALSRQKLAERLGWYVDQAML